MGLRDLNFSNIATCLFAAVTLASTVVRAADTPRVQAGHANGNASARLILGATVVPIVQTSKPSPAHSAKNQNIDFDLAPQHYESRYRVRELPIDQALGSDLAPAVLETLTIVPE